MTNYFKYALYAIGTILGIIILYQVYKLIIKIPGDINTAAETAAASAQNKNLAKSTGVEETRIDELRNLSKEIARELETWKDMTFIDRQTHLVLDTDVVKILQRVKSSTEMAIVKAFYKNDFTSSRDLAADVRSEISSGNLSKINFI